jgi:amino acid transporter
MLQSKDLKGAIASDTHPPIDTASGEIVGEIRTEQNNAGFHRNFTPRQIHV